MQYTYITREKTKLGKKNEERGGPCRQRQSGRPNDAGHVRVAADVTGRSVSLPIGRRRIPPMASVIASSGPEAVNGPDLLLLFRFSLSLSLSFSFSCVASIAVEADGDAGVLLVRRCGRARRRDAETRTPLVGSATRLGPRRRSLRFAISNAIGWKASQSRCTPRETVPFIG